MAAKMRLFISYLPVDFVVEVIFSLYLSGSGAILAKLEDFLESLSDFLVGDAIGVVDSDKLSANEAGIICDKDSVVVEIDTCEE